MEHHPSFTFLHQISANAIPQEHTSVNCFVHTLEMETTNSNR